MGGLAARVGVKALARIAPSAPWGTLPTSHWEVVSAQGLYLAGQFWNKPLRPEAWIAETHARHDGAYDRVNPAKTVASIAWRYRERAEYFEVENASHWLIGEPGWEKTAHFVREWVTNATSPVAA